VTQADATGAHDPVGSELSRRLRQLRTDRQLTQKQLAALLGVSNALVSAWEQGMSVPPRARIAQYVVVFSDGNETLMDELLNLATEVEPRMRPQMPPEGLLDVMKDVRWLLVKILDRLPPATTEKPTER
jgi:transcriptional regulator with XRE-family HTH domain